MTYLYRLKAKVLQERIKTNFMMVNVKIILETPSAVQPKNDGNHAIFEIFR